MLLLLISTINVSRENKGTNLFEKQIFLGQFG